MSKYAPLEKFLGNSTAVEISMKFEDIERIIGCSLPTSSKKYPAWWSNESSTHVQAEAWKSAGYRTASVNLADEKLLFIRETAAARPSLSPQSGKSPHPIFGCMKGSVTTPESVDLTAPSMPEWGEMASNAKRPE